jgi:pSer/pThr/pTyr-binding forkhead associated (FHA) protein
MVGHEVTLEDLNSTNGTYVNGKAVKKQLLQNGDTIEVGKYKIRFIAELESSEYDKTMVVKPGLGRRRPGHRAGGHGATRPAAGRRSPGGLDQGAVGLGGRARSA